MCVTFVGKSLPENGHLRNSSELSKPMPDHKNRCPTSARHAGPMPDPMPVRKHHCRPGESFPIGKRPLDDHRRCGGSGARGNIPVASRSRLWQNTISGSVFFRQKMSNLHLQSSLEKVRIGKSRVACAPLLVVRGRGDTHAIENTPEMNRTRRGDQE